MTAPTVKLTPALLAELDAKAERGERASPEPWVAHDEYVSSRHELVGRMSSTATADFIVAASPATVRALVAAVRVGEKALEITLEHRFASASACVSPHPATKKVLIGEWRRELDREARVALGTEAADAR
jgi:hypothetical protein